MSRKPVIFLIIAIPLLSLGSGWRLGQAQDDGTQATSTPLPPVEGLELLYDNGSGLVVYGFRVDGHAMHPILPNDTLVFVDRAYYENHPFERGDIVVLDPPVDGASKPYIKRIIGLPGETIEFREGSVIIDGHELAEPYLDGTVTECSGTRHCGPTPIPDGQLFVLGDNRPNSSDSRSFGPITVDRILARAWFWYQPSDGGLVSHADRP